MSLYNMLFGESQSADVLLNILGLTRDDFYRYRDCYLTEDGQIAVYTRGGGGNRKCFCGGWDGQDEIKDPVELNGETHERTCVVLYHHRLRQHPCYLYDEDDDFDPTYATFYFRIPEDADREKLAQIKPELGREEVWNQFLLALQSMKKP